MHETNFELDTIARLNKTAIRFQVVVRDAQDLFISSTISADSALVTLLQVSIMVVK